METERLLIQLNSFVHRVDNKAEIIQLAAQHGCVLKRIRRSRHWQISGGLDQLRLFSSAITVPWISAKIEQACEPFKPAVTEILERNPDISVMELVQQSGCTVAEARAAIDEHEGF
ncbi:ribosome recycling factor family protein [Vibrio hippocampi]|uniref:Ribosome recycling factor n=1 Tax=Vibrio hippocampi TaxID=654686 RepID=A0ABM8ZH00_9VIBR|nr:ribosome recycling factor family protein [Vibrio hippocampi]CAH0525659.1 hypothetical protein VHP8226_01187 [Vibrio hippocampi]